MINYFVSSSHVKLALAVPKAMRSCHVCLLAKKDKILEALSGIMHVRFNEAERSRGFKERGQGE